MDDHHWRNFKVEECAGQSLNAMTSERPVRVTLSTVAMGEVALVRGYGVLVRPNLK